MQDFLAFAQALQVALKAMQLYAVEHPKCIEALEGLAKATEPLTAQHESLQIIASQGRLFIDGKPVDRVTPHTLALIKQLTEREISGFLLQRGLNVRELESLVRVLIMKPQKIRESGGFSEILARDGVSRIRLSQIRYEELYAGEEIVRIDSLKNDDGTFDLNAIMRDLFRPLAASARNAAASEAEPSAPAPTTDLSATLLDPAAPKPLDLEAVNSRLTEASEAGEGDFAAQLTKSLLDSPPEVQAQLLTSRESLPEGPLRKALDELAPSLAMNIAAAAAQQDFSVGNYPAIVSFLFSHLRGADRSLARLRARLDTLGIGNTQLEEMIEVLSWEMLSMDEKIAWINEGHRIYEVPGERLLHFFRDLLVQGRHPDFMALVERYGLALQSESAELRRNVLDNFVRIAGWSRDPGFLPAEETMLQKMLFTHFLREPDQRLQNRSADAVSAFLGSWMQLGRTEKAIRAIMNLQSGATAAASQLPWKIQAYDALVAQLAKDHVRRLAEQLHTREHDGAGTELQPLLTLLGAPAAAELIDVLAAEDDRANRARIVRAIKAIGRPALIPLRLSLKSPTWFLVRNTLNLLGDLGAIELVDEVGETLHHSDPRVQKTAARALSKIGGTRAEHLLIAALSKPDPELQSEIVYCLGGMKAEAAIEVVAELAKPKRIGGDDSLRERAVDALGAIGSARAIPVLEELLRKRSLLSGSESPEMRIAAAKALAQINTPEARLVIKKAAENESNSGARVEMEKLAQA